MMNSWERYNSEGFIPGEAENETAFLRRISYCKALKDNFEAVTEITLSSEEKKEMRSCEALNEAFPHTEELWGIRPTWVPLLFSNRGLALWHGGCAWIFQANEEAPLTAFLQLQERFAHAKTLYGIYGRSELIAHELSHVARLQYQDEKFEEIFAYQSSRSRLRRWLGPIFCSMREVLFFLALLALTLFTDILSFFYAIDEALAWVRALPFLYVLCGIVRLTGRHRRLRRCRVKLEELLQKKEARHLSFRLLDREIALFSKLSQDEIRAYIDRAAHSSFRWQFLKAIYLRTCDSLTLSCRAK